MHSSFARDAGGDGGAGCGGGAGFATSPAGGRISRVAAWKKSDAAGFAGGAADASAAGSEVRGSTAGGATGGANTTGGAGGADAGGTTGAAGGPAHAGWWGAAAGACGAVDVGAHFDGRVISLAPAVLAAVGVADHLTIALGHEPEMRRTDPSGHLVS